jgi:predicted N-acetyltransferase YhbS
MTRDVMIRRYQPADYPAILALYTHSATFGGHVDENRDAEERLRKRIEADPDAILVAEQNDSVVGTVSLIEDGRVAWLFRFAVMQDEHSAAVAKALCDAALIALTQKGHRQVLVYTPVGNAELDSRYEQLGFQRGDDYTCYWKDI